MSRTSLRLLKPIKLASMPSGHTFQVKSLSSQRKKVCPWCTSQCNVFYSRPLIWFVGLEDSWLCHLGEQLRMQGMVYWITRQCEDVRGICSRLERDPQFTEVNLECYSPGKTKRLSYLTGWKKWRWLWQSASSTSETTLPRTLQAVQVSVLPPM